MNAVLIIITVVQLLVALALILIVLFQSGKSQGLSGAIGGIADSYMSRSKAKSMDAKLARGTKWVAAVFCGTAPGFGLHGRRRHQVNQTDCQLGDAPRPPAFFYGGEFHERTDLFRSRPGGAGRQPYGPPARLRPGRRH